MNSNLPIRINQRHVMQINCMYPFDQSEVEILDYVDNYRKLIFEEFEFEKNKKIYRNWYSNFFLLKFSMLNSHSTMIFFASNPNECLFRLHMLQKKRGKNYHLFQEDFFY